MKKSFLYRAALIFSSIISFAATQNIYAECLAKEALELIAGGGICIPDFTIQGCKTSLYERMSNGFVMCKRIDSVCKLVVNTAELSKYCKLIKEENQCSSLETNADVCVWVDNTIAVSADKNDKEKIEIEALRTINPRANTIDDIICSPSAEQLTAGLIKIMKSDAAVLSVSSQHSFIIRQIDKIDESREYRIEFLQGIGKKRPNQTHQLKLVTLLDEKRGEKMKGLSAQDIKMHLEELNKKGNTLEHAVLKRQYCNLSDKVIINKVAQIRAPIFVSTPSH